MEISGTFPLYRSLVQTTKKTSKDLTKCQKEFFVNSSNKLPDHVHELIYTLIMHWSKENLDTEMTSERGVPLDGKFIDTGTVEFNFNTFPRHLKHILHEFIKLHMAGDELVGEGRSDVK